MKCITLHQPWASLFVLGLKRIETRGWRTNYRGELFIHAGKKVVPFDQLFDDLTFGQRYEIMQNICAEYGDYSLMPTGMIIAKCNLVDCIPTQDLSQSMTAREISFGDYTPGRYGWIFEDVEPIKPIQAKGKQGFWNFKSVEVVTPIHLKGGNRIGKY